MSLSQSVHACVFTDASEKHIRSCLAPAAARGALSWDSSPGWIMLSSPQCLKSSFTLPRLPAGGWGCL